MGLAANDLAFAAFLIFIGLFIGLIARNYSSDWVRAVADGPEHEPYRIYTRQFDLTLPAEEVLATLEAASLDSSKGWLEGGNTDRTPALLETEAILADQEAGLLGDHGPLLARLRSSCGELDPEDMVVGLLIDQSGSMRGRPIALAAVTATLITGLLSDLGARSEVLGFSTAGWHGGHARMKWIEDGKPDRPGRLCATMHVIYKSADVAVLSREARQVMVNPDLLRENVDGEAIQWACERLVARPERYKLLVVISDGAPVDDSTLLQNGPNYLYRHLMKVFRDIADDGRVILGGIGINHRVDEYYKLSETVLSPDDVPEAGMHLLESLLAASGKTR